MTYGQQKWLIIIAALMILLGQHILRAEEKIDSVKKAKEILQDARVKADKKEIEITVRSVDISEFPTITIMIEAYNKLGEPLDTLVADNLFVHENGVQKKIIKVEKIPIAEKVPVDFVFVLDKTGSMQQSINNIRKHISSFTRTLISRGIDYRLGLVIFGDDLEKVYDPTETVAEFLHWMSTVKARGGGDEKENALEALEAATNLNYRPAANKVAVLITDAPYHQKGEDGFGVTNQTTESIIEELQLSEVRVFSIVPPKLVNYKLISSKTRGNFYDIDYPFSTILDNFSNQITNLYNLTYTYRPGKHSRFNRDCTLFR
jgi:Mg-chelatase subunit ChlD